MTLTNENQNKEYTDFIDEMKEIYDKLLEFIDNIEAKDEDFMDLVHNIENKGLDKNKEEFNSFLKVLIDISNNHHRKNGFFDKLERILHKFEKSLKENNTNQEIYEIFESNKRLLYFLIKEKIITIDEEIKQLIESHVPRYSDFFIPEIQIKDNDKSYNNDYYKEYITEYESKRQTGENDSYICSLIREDLIEEFVSYINKTNTSVSSMIEPSIFETNSFLINNKPTLIEYAAFFGSIQIFQYLCLSKAKMSKSLWLYAIHSNNSDLLQNYIGKYVKPTNDTYKDVFIECIKCHHNKFARYIKDNLITHEDQSQQESFDQQAYESILKYHNYSFFPTKFNNSYSFYYLFKYDYQFITKILIQTCQAIIQGKTKHCIFSDCSIYYILETSYEYQKPTLLEKIKESKTVFINIVKHNIDNDKNIYLYIGIKDSILFINLRSIALINELFKYHQLSKFCFLNDENAKELIDEFTTNQSIENYIDIRALKKSAYNEIKNLYGINRKNPPIDFVFIGFHHIILLFLTTEAYNKINRRSKNRTKYFISDYTHPPNTSTNIIKNDDFIEIANIHHDKYFHRNDLVYYINKKEMIVIKYPKCNDCEAELLFRRESLFYETMKHPYLPIFYGVLENNGTSNQKMITIEFINGKSLCSIKELHLGIKDKITIIFKLMIIIEYFHHNKFIYRKLNPSHVMIDNNKEVILVGFSRAIKYDPYLDDECHTCDLGSEFVAPEVNAGKISFKSDIYSLGMMILYIINEEIYYNESKNNKEGIFQYPEINQIIKNCTKESPKERPSICDLLIEFYFYFHTLIDIGNLIKVYEECFSNIYDMERIRNLIKQAQNDQEDVDFKIGMLYYEAELCSFDYNKSIQYFQKASMKHFGKAKQILDIISKNKCQIHILNQSQIRAQMNLGYFYLSQNEINRSVYFFTLAADQNNPESQHQLGLIFYENKFVQQDIYKSIHYFTLAANQNKSESQHQLGLIYYEYKFVQRDINKAIHYFTLAANQNKPESQHQLGLIYYENKFVQQDILKAIEFFSHADEQNYVESQLMLGKIYYEENYVQRDAHNVIYYYSRAAEHNNVEALRFLGQIYYNDEIVYRDIQNSIYYFRLASKQNDSISQCFLGDIYYENKYIERNIDKAIYYFTLAANQNNADAQFNLGVIYFEGKFVTQDLSRAKSYFSMAAKQNHQKTIYYLTTLIPKSNI